MKADKVFNYLFMCHRLPERSFFFRGKQLPLCARCTGILAGYFIGIIYIIFVHRSNILFEGMLIIPTAIDGTGQYFGKWISTNRRRFITGVLAGFSVICIFRFMALLGTMTGNYIVKLIFNK